MIFVNKNLFFSKLKIYHIRSELKHELQVFSFPWHRPPAPKKLLLIYLVNLIQTSNRKQEHDENGLLTWVCRWLFF